MDAPARPRSRAARSLALALCLVAAAPFVSSCGPRTSGARGFDVLLVTLDTLRADRLGSYGGHVATPALDRVAREGARFDQAMTAAPLTLPSHATILTGLLPPHHGLRNNGAGHLPDRVATLATRLSAAGYRTGAFVGSFVLDHRFGLARGFDVYDDAIDRGDEAGRDALEAERPGSVVVDRALAWLDAAPRDARPSFLWVHLYDAHAPYDPPEPYRSRYANPYDGEVAGVDAQVGRLLAAIDRRAAARRTVVVVLGDHGEALGEHGEQTHGLLLYEPTLRVPLLVRAPGVIPAGTVVRAPVSLADVAPTLAALLGLPAQPLDGRDLAPALTRGADVTAADLYAETEYPRLFGWAGLAAVRRDGRKYIDAPHAELYDVVADAGETRNLLAPGADTGAFTRALARLRGHAAEADPVTDADARARLASLGYVGGSAGGTTAAAARDPKDAAPLFRRFEDAHRALRAGRIDEAAGALDALLREDPQNPVFCGVLAEAEQKRGRLARAIELYRAETALRPDDGAARYSLALALQKAGRTPEATAALEEALRRDDRFPEAHNALGIALAAADRPHQALDEFGRALLLDPRNARAQNNRGNVLRALGRVDEAEGAYREALAIDPRYADPHTGLGALALARDDAAHALDEFDRALALAPDEHDILVNRGIALEMLGRTDEARSAYRRFLAVAGRAPEFAPARDAARQLLARLDATSGSRPAVSR